METPDLFDVRPEPGVLTLGERAMVLQGFALQHTDALLKAIASVCTSAPWRNMVTPGGFTMSVQQTNCGALGWTSSRRGYRYTPADPDSGAPWPSMPEVFACVAADAAAAAGFSGFVPDACLLNRYLPGSKLSLHQDRNERDYAAPVVSVSLGMAAIFLFGGHERSDPSRKAGLLHGDVAVWGGADRLRFHGVMPLQGPAHPGLGAQRISLTFRKAG